MGDVSNTRPTAEGTLAARPLAHLLVYTRTRRLTGRLVLRSPEGGGGAIAMWNGNIAAAWTAPPSTYFAAVAVELGFVDATTAEATLRDAMGQKRLHGELLVERGKITAAQRDQALSEQTARKVHKLLSLPPASMFQFFEDPASPSQPPLALDAALPVWRGIRDGSSDKSVRDVVAPFLIAQLRVVDEASFARAGFSPQEKVIAQALKARPMSITQIRAQFPAFPHEKLDRIIYFLLIIKAAEASMNIATPQSVPGGPAGVVPGGRGAMAPEAIAAALKQSMRPAAPPPSMPPSTGALRNSAAPAYPSGPTGVSKSAPPPRVSGSVPPLNMPAQSRVPSFRKETGHIGTPQASPATSSAAQSEPKAPPGPADLGVAGITARARNVEEEEPAVTLGLSGEPTIEAAKAAYFRLVKLWHPDRIPGELATVREDVGKIFVQMTKAHQTLTDPESRRAYLLVKNAKPVVAAGPPRRDVIRFIDITLNKKDFGLAGEEAKRLLAANPRDAEAQALVAWIGSAAGEGPEAAIRGALPLLDRAVNDDPDCTRAVFYRGMIHKRLGNTNGAYRDFVRAVQNDPKHVDAAREVRIHEMRAKKR